MAGLATYDSKGSNCSSAAQGVQLYRMGEQCLSHGIVETHKHENVSRDELFRLADCTADPEHAQGITSIFCILRAFLEGKDTQGCAKDTLEHQFYTTLSFKCSTVERPRPLNLKFVLPL